METKQKRAAEWFSSLQSHLIEILENLENEATLPAYPPMPGKFRLKPWLREGGGRRNNGHSGGPGL